MTGTVSVKCIADDALLATGDGIARFTIPNSFHGLNLTNVGAHVYTVSSSGAISIAIYNETDSSDMLSVNLTIDASELDSVTAATGPTINTSEDDVVEGDVIRIDVDGDGTGTEGLEVRLTFS